MEKTHLIKMMEEIIQSYEEHLNKNEGSTLSAIASSAKMTFEGLKASLSGNETLKSSIKTFKEYMEKLEEALKNGDRQLSANVLDLMKQAVQKLKSAEPGKAPQ